MRPQPFISVIVPSYNQAGYLDACLASIVEQDYANREIIVMDGGSKDGSTGVIKKYEPKLAYWQSRPDGGQVAAIQGGIDKSRGRLLTWLNSDDVLLPGALRANALAYARHDRASVFYGDHVLIDKDGAIVDRHKHPAYFNRLAWLTMPYIAQPGTCFTRDLWERVGGADPQLHCAFDYDLWYRFMAVDARFVHVNTFVSAFRRHEEAKGATLLELYAREHAILRERWRDRMGTATQRRVARLLLIMMQTLSGSYLYTLTFRLLEQRRLTHYKL